MKIVIAAYHERGFKQNESPAYIMQCIKIVKEDILWKVKKSSSRKNS